MSDRYVPPDIGLPEAYPHFNAVVYSADVFLPIVNLHMEPYWLPDAGRGPVIARMEWCNVTLRWGTVLRAWLWFEIGAGWFFTTMFVIGFTGVIRKE